MEDRIYKKLQALKDSINLMLIDQTLSSQLQTKSFIGTLSNFHNCKITLAYQWDTFLLQTRGRGGLTHHLHSEAPAGNRRMAMTFAKLRLIVFLRCTGLDWMPL